MSGLGLGLRRVRRYIYDLQNVCFVNMQAGY